MQILKSEQYVVCTYLDIPDYLYIKEHFKYLIRKPIRVYRRKKTLKYIANNYL